MAALVRMPMLFVPHGGGPWPWYQPNGMTAAEDRSMRTFLTEEIPRVVSGAKAVLVISAHWEASVPTIQANEQPPLYFDYGGFPDHTYQLTWPAKGAPWLVQRLQKLLPNAETDSRRGYDHGTFVPMKLALPEPTVPIVQLSILRSLNPAEHLELGRQLAPLRDEGVVIIGSGMTFHNMRAFFSGDPNTKAARAFDQWLVKTVESGDLEGLKHWDKAPSAAYAHPRHEHLLPVHVLAGAAGSGATAKTVWSGTVMGFAVSAFLWE